MLFRIKQKIISYLKRSISQLNAIGRDVIVKKNVVVIGSRIGNKSIINEDSRIIDSELMGRCIIGMNTELDSVSIYGDFESQQNCKLHKCYLYGTIKLGKYTSLWGPNLDLYANKESIIIGDFCSIARNVTFQTYNHNHKKLTTYFIGANLFNENWENEQVSKGDIILHNDIWIGSHCVVLGGVTIHNGAVVAANSVVNNDVPAFSIVAGTPAKVIGYRFDEETIAKIQEMKWWDWSLEKIKANKHLFEDNWDNNLKEKS